MPLETVPDNRESFPVQRWFGVDSGQRQMSELQALEIRIRDLEAAYGLKFMQSAEATATNTQTIAQTARYAASQAWYQATPSIIGPTISMKTVNDTDLLLVYYEITVRNTDADAADIMDYAAYLHDSVNGLYYRLGNFQELQASTTYVTVPDGGDLNTPSGATDYVGGKYPRGGQMMLHNLPTGDHTFSLAVSVYQPLSSAGASLEFTTRYLALDVV